MNEILDEKKSWLFYKTWNNMFLKLPNAEAGELVKAMCALEEGEEYTIKNPILEAVFYTIKEQMLANTERFYKEKERRQNASKKGVEARAEKKKQSDNESLTSGQRIVNESLTNRLPNATYKDKDKDKDKVEDKDKVKNILPPYSPPKGGEADSSLRSESRQNIDGYTPPKPERMDYQGVLDAYHECCPSFPAVIKLTETRKRAIKARLKDYGLDEIKRAFSLAGQSDFLKGSSGWQASFDWLMKPANMTKVLEGNYTNRASPAGGKSKSMWGEDDYLAKLARGEVSLGEEDWFKSIKNPDIIDEKGGTA